MVSIPNSQAVKKGVATQNGVIIKKLIGIDITAAISWLSLFISQFFSPWPLLGGRTIFSQLGCYFYHSPVNSAVIQNLYLVGNIDIHICLHAYTYPLLDPLIKSS